MLLNMAKLKVARNKPEYRAVMHDLIRLGVIRLEDAKTVKEMIRKMERIDIEAHKAKTRQGAVKPPAKSDDKPPAKSGVKPPAEGGIKLIEDKEALEFLKTLPVDEQKAFDEWFGKTRATIEAGADLAELWKRAKAT
jgi:hypothetical protein